MGIGSSQVTVDTKRTALDKSDTRILPYVSGFVYDGAEWVPELGGPAFYDAFGRQRVSSPQTLFDSKLTQDNAPLKFDDQETSGSGTGSTWDQNKASVVLDVSNTTAGTRVRQSRVRPTYQPGKSQLAFITFTMGAAATGITRRVGLFDGSNGIFLEQTASAVKWVVRTNSSGTPSDANAVAQASWSENTLPALDLQYAQIAVIDFEWLGVGTVRVGFVVDGAIQWVHHFHWANANTGVYMSTGNLPVRYELSNDGTGAAATLECICSSVNSEGGRADTGLSRAVDTGIAGFTTLNNTSTYPVLALRLDSTGLTARIVPELLQLLCTSTANYRWALLLNPTFTGTALSFTDVANSATEVATPGNGTTITAEGTVLASGYASDTVQNRAGVGPQLSDFQLGSAIDGTSDVLVLAVTNLSAGAETYHAMLGWREAP